MSQSKPKLPQNRFSVRFGKNEPTKLEQTANVSSSDRKQQSSSRKVAFGQSITNFFSGNSSRRKAIHTKGKAVGMSNRDLRNRSQNSMRGGMSREVFSGSCLIDSLIWNFLLVSFTFLLLFGPQIQDLSISKDSDGVFNILYLIAFCMFGLDIIIRCFVEKQYFEVNFFCCSKTQYSIFRNGCCIQPSMLFWCELLSTSTLLYEISSISPRFTEKTIDILMTDMGGTVLEKNLGGIYYNFPINLNVGMLITIVRTLRVFRAFRASTISVFNWYWLYQRINPLYHWRQYRISRCCFKGEEEQVAYRARNPNMSWATLSMSYVVHARQSKIEEEKRKGWNLGKVIGIRQIMRYVGLRSHQEQIRREVAAIRIQRAWRASFHKVRDYGANDCDDRNSEHDAWAPSTELKTHQLESRRSLRPTVGPQTNYLTMSVRGKMNTEKNHQSQVGSTMRELTGHRVAIFIILALILTVIFTYTELDATPLSTMIFLHLLVKNGANGTMAFETAGDLVNLYQFERVNGTDTEILFKQGKNQDEPGRERETLKISTVENNTDITYIGLFDQREELRNSALVEMLSTIFIVLVWFFGVSAFAGPVMTLVVIPIERMVRLLTMLMQDPLGYQSTARYKKFVSEEDELSKNSRWTREVLKGMETHFLMSTILRIGSLMKVGFGSAGVEIIRSSLERGKNKNVLNLDTKGSSVSCIFLFCDIRQFTDATESLQEEVFVFTNRIAAVVHSICNAYGGSANKNIGDAFLLSWLLEEASSKRGSSSGLFGHRKSGSFTAKNNQADKALLAVVKICMALYHDKFYIETMSEVAREALLEKLSEREGPVVQMGFGLHAGTAVQGAIGSQRKIDATYVSESVELAEFLESSTKKYGLKMLMSGNFHRLLSTSNRRRCRKIDQILMQNDDEKSDDLPFEESDVMELFTFDMDIDALWDNSTKMGTENVDTISDTDSSKGFTTDLEKKPSLLGSQRSGFTSRRRSMKNKLRHEGPHGAQSEEFAPVSSMTESASVAAASLGAGVSGELGAKDTTSFRRLESPDLVLPTGQKLYNQNIWMSEDMKRIREKFQKDFPFFQKFRGGLESYYNKEWVHAKQSFETILVKFDDGPSKYFLKLIEDNNGEPPPNFLPYGTP